MKTFGCGYCGVKKILEYFVGSHDINYSFKKPFLSEVVEYFEDRK
jgi:hypothetical protein